MALIERTQPVQYSYKGSHETTVVKVAVWVQRVKKQSFDFLYFFTGSVLCMVQRVYPENLSVIGCFLPEI